jgi:hypothetical protein
VVEAVERSLAGGNESARVAAVKFLADLELYKPDDKEDRTRDMAVAAAEARQYVANELARRGATTEDDRMRDLIKELSLWLQEAVDRHPDLVVGQMSPEMAEEVLHGLEELGLIVPRGKLEAMAEARALELLAAMKAEHGNPCVSQPRVPGLDPVIQERAGLTDKQAQLLPLGTRAPLRFSRSVVAAITCAWQPTPEFDAPR